MLSAILIIASQIWPFDKIGAVSIIAAVFLAALIAHSLIKRSYFGVFIPLSILYMIFSKPLMLIYISPWLLILSALLVSIGFSLLFQKHTGRVMPSHEGKGYNGRGNECVDEDNPYVKVVMNSISKYLYSENLRGAHFTADMATLEVYFDQVQLCNDSAEIFIQCNLSSIDLYVPKHWNVIDNTHSYLGWMDYGAGRAEFSENAPKLILSGNVVLGDVNIHFIGAETHLESL